MNYFQTTFMGNDLPQDDVPQQPYAEPVEFKSALVDEFLAELGITSLEFNSNNITSPEYQSPTSSLSELSETAGPSRGPDEWVDHVTANRGNASFDSITDYAPATMAFTSESTLPSVPDHTIADPYFLTQPVLNFSPSALSQPLLSPALPLRPVGMVSDLYLPLPSHVSNLPIATSAGYPSSLPYGITSSGGAIINDAFDLHEPLPVELELLDPNHTTQPSWLPRDDAEAGWAYQNGQGHLDFSFDTFSGHDDMDAVQNRSPPPPTVPPALPGALPIAAVVCGQGGQSATILGKRAHREPEVHGNSGQGVGEDAGVESRPSPCKKGKTAIGAKEAAGPSKRTQKSPAAMAPKSINVKSKSVDSGAQTLIVITAQGVSRQLLKGPRVSSKLAESLGEEGRGSAEGEMVKNETADGQGKARRAGYPTKGPYPVEALQEDLTPREVALLMVTPDELQCGLMETLRCKLCPVETFSNRADFQRHCSKCEAHPDVLFACEKCGDCFARKFACTRHSESKSACKSWKWTPEAASKKIATVQNILAGYERDFCEWAQNGTPIEAPFAERVRGVVETTSKWTRRKTATKKPRASRKSRK